MSNHNFDVVMTVIAGIWALVQMIPQVRKWRVESKTAIIVDALEAGVQAAYTLVTRPARQSGIVKLPDDIREEAMEKAILVTIQTAQDHGLNLTDIYNRSELRAKLAEVLTTRKDMGIIGGSAGANKTIATEVSTPGVTPKGVNK